MRLSSGFAEPDEPTDVIPLPANQVFSIGTVKVTGPVVQGSTATNITTNYGASSDALVKLVAQFREILTAADLPDVDREAIEVDLDVIEEEGAAAQPRARRLRALLLRLQGVLIGSVLAGVEASTKQEAIQLIEVAQKALPPG
jgi:hypothetical protein